MMILNDQHPWCRSNFRWKTFQTWRDGGRYANPFTKSLPKQQRDLPFQPPNLQHTLLSDMLSLLLKTDMKIKQEIFQWKYQTSQNKISLLLFFRHQGATNISTSCQLRYQTPSWKNGNWRVETDGSSRWAATSYKYNPNYPFIRPWLYPLED